MAPAQQQQQQQPQASALPLPSPVPLPEIDLYALLGRTPDDALVRSTLAQLARQTDKGESAADDRDEKAYPGATYHVFPSLPFSYAFDPVTRFINQLDLTSPIPPPSSVHPLASPSPTSSPPSSSPPTPAPLSSSPVAKASALPWPLTLSTTLLDLLPLLGEPQRKGGGLENVGRLGPGVWVEWADVVLPSPFPSPSAASAPPAAPNARQRKRGLYVEFEVRGAGCWERSALEGQRWKSCMLFDS